MNPEEERPREDFGLGPSCDLRVSFFSENALAPAAAAAGGAHASTVKTVFRVIPLQRTVQKCMLLRSDPERTYFILGL